MTVAEVPLWLSNLAFWSAQVAVLVLAAGFLPRLFRIYQPRVLLVYWRTLLAISLLLPFVEPWRRAQSIATIAVAPPTDVTRVVTPSSPALSHWNLPSFQIIAQILGVVILVGIAVRFVIFALGLLKLRQFRRTSSPLSSHVESAESVAVLEQMRTRVNAHAEFRLSADVDSPVTFGFSAPVILFPETFPSMDALFQAAIACHELLHARRHDWVHHLGEEIIRAALWFHPAIAWLIAHVRLAREQVVDHEVVKLTKSPKPYVEALLEFTNGRTASIPAPPFLVERQLAQRVALMLKEVRMSRARLISSLTVIACTLALAATFAVWTFPLKAAPRIARSATQTAITPEASSGAVAQEQPPVASKPVVDANTIWTDKVKKGDMVLQVRGEGKLVRADNSDGWVARVTLPEDPARDVRVGQNAAVQTREGVGIAKGHVSSISSSVVYGVRSMDVALDSPLPAGVGVNSPVSATIDIGKLENILYVGRAADPWEETNSEIPVFKVIDNGKEAVQVRVKFGRASVSTIQVLSGLNLGDTVILSDMAPYLLAKFDRIQIKH
ncbi:MAG TPA: M56 family metallopeptidase [Candidatus Acidoferrales bacterium]|nr:M56 family metallopeptidase [Candidatus Acidoferrales bacterium]